MEKDFLGLSTIVGFLIPLLSLPILFIGLFVEPSWSVEIEKVEVLDSPSIDKDQRIVELRTQVTSYNNKPVNFLDFNHFQLFLDCKLMADCQPLDSSYIVDWRNPKEAEPPPAWLVILFDFSGSMKRADSRGVIKLVGAIEAIREFNESLADRSNNTQISIVPFGESGSSCTGYPVRDKTLDKFVFAGDVKLDNYLSYLEQQKDSLCASTNLYDPLRTSVEFLNDSESKRFNPCNKQKTERCLKPRLSIILLSDGYHSVGDEEQDFKELADFLAINKNVVIHTLGYGLTPEKLAQKCRISSPFQRKDIDRCKNKVAKDEFVDQDRLREIAEMTGGIFEFSEDATKVSEKLREFLDAILGEYIISYRQPISDRAESHLVSVEVTTGNSKIQSEQVSYTMPWVAPAPSMPTRIKFLFCVLATLAVCGGVPFWMWLKLVKRKFR